MDHLIVSKAETEWILLREKLDFPESLARDAPYLLSFLHFIAIGTIKVRKKSPKYAL